MSQFALSAQQVVFMMLNNSQELDGLLAPHSQFQRSGIYDFVPQFADSGDNDHFPLITIGEDSLDEWSTDTSTGADATVDIHIWSRSKGWSEAKQIAKAVFGILNRSEPSATDAEVIGFDWESDECIRDSDGLTLHMVTSYRVLMDQEGFGE